MQIIKIDPLTDKRWDEFVLNHKLGLIYHHSLWAAVLKKTYNHIDPLIFTLLDDDGEIKALIPTFLVKSWITGTRIVSLPFTPYCDPIFEESDEFDYLLASVISEMKKTNASYLEVRTRKTCNLIKNKTLKKLSYYKTFILKLNDDPEILKTKFHKTSVQQRINRAKRNNVIIKKGKNEEDMMKFYQLQILTRRKHGFPIQPYQLFHNLWSILYPKGFLTLLLAEFQNKPIAGTVLLKFKQTVSYEYSASNPSYLKYSPVQLLLWKAILLSFEEGYKYFDFGKTPSTHKGLIDFKRRWATEEIEVPYFYFPKIKGITSIKENKFKHRLMLKLGYYMPLSLAKVWGKILYNHLG